MTSIETPVRFHLSLNVSNLDRAVAFFEELLLTPVAKRRADYAKFELENPPLVLSLEPRSPQEHGSLNHLGFRFADTKSLVELQRQLETLGIATEREEGVECCYAKQTKFWVNDFDQRLWEFYVLEGDLDHRGEGQSLEKMVGADTAAAAITRQSQTAVEPAIWEHRMGSPFSLPSDPCREIRLRGTFNVPTFPAVMNNVLEQSFHRLVPGGKIALHMLTCEDELCETPTLPGPAAYVKYVPVRSVLMQALEDAGFEDLVLTTFRSGACFEFKGHPLRETRIEARRPAGEPISESKLADEISNPADQDDISQQICKVMFKGPFKEIHDDAGTRWRRGELTTISAARWAALKDSTVGSMFVELPEEAAVAHCGVSRAAS